MRALRLVRDWDLPLKEGISTNGLRMETRLVNHSIVNQRNLVVGSRASAFRTAMYKSYVVEVDGMMDVVTEVAFEVPIQEETKRIKERNKNDVSVHSTQRGCRNRLTPTRPTGAAAKAQCQ